jgi:nitrogen regulatory protein P-II 1
MKRIEAIIRPDKVTEVCAALDRVGHPGVTISTVEGRGSQQGWINQVRGVSHNVSVFTRSKVEVVVKDEDADRIIIAIRDAALTGEVGDGKIFVHDMVTAIRIRTNENGMAAI